MLFLVSIEIVVDSLLILTRFLPAVRSNWIMWHQLNRNQKEHQPQQQPPQQHQDDRMSSPIRTSKRKAAEVEAAAAAEADVSVPIKEEEAKTAAEADPPIIKKPRKDIAAKAAAEDDKETEAMPDAGTDGADAKKGTEETDKPSEETAATGKPEEEKAPAADRAIKEEPVTVPAAIYKEEDDFDEPDDGAEIVEDSDEVWNQSLFNLLLYKNQYKTLHVQATYDPTLHSWVDTQRKLYRRHRKEPKSVSPVTAKRLIALDSINFPFTLRGAAHWERYFNKLQDFHKKHGHCLVPRLCEFPGLGDWVIDQRRQYKLMMQGKPSVLDPERQRKLEQLGFVWVVRNRPEWNNRFQELLQFREKHGDTKVPQHYKEIPGLGKVRIGDSMVVLSCFKKFLFRFVSSQRRCHVAGLSLFFPVGRQAARTIQASLAGEAFLSYARQIGKAQ